MTLHHLAMLYGIYATTPAVEGHFYQAQQQIVKLDFFLFHFAMGIRTGLIDFYIKSRSAVYFCTGLRQMVFSVGPS